MYLEKAVEVILAGVAAMRARTLKKQEKEELFEAERTLENLLRFLRRDYFPEESPEDIRELREARYLRLTID